MKIRSGFVSNSSTSSFIIVGWLRKNIPQTLINEKNLFGLELIEDEYDGEYYGLCFMDWGEHPRIKFEEMQNEIERYNIFINNTVPILKEKYNLPDPIVEQVIKVDG